MVPVVTGSLVIAAGATLSGIYSFEGRFTHVYLGFMVFIIGYSLSQRWLHGDGGSMANAVSIPGIKLEFLIRIMLLLGGIAGIAFGVTLFSQTILEPSLESAVVSGVSSIGGYTVAHVAINLEGLGWSLFSDLREIIVGLKRRFE